LRGWLKLLSYMLLSVPVSVCVCFFNPLSENFNFYSCDLLRLIPLVRIVLTLSSQMKDIHSC